LHVYSARQNSSSKQQPNNQKIARSPSPFLKYFR
jgi:hypothetical protein